MKKARKCSQGHTYYKTSDCPTCPKCEAAKRPDKGFMALLSAPARRALQAANIKTLKQLAQFSEEQLLQMHGFGPSSIPKLRTALKAVGLELRK